MKESLVREFATIDDASRAREIGLPNPFRAVTSDVVLQHSDD